MPPFRRSWSYATNCKPIPDDVELGIHLCYGDFGATHFIEPIDAAKMVEAANALTRAIRHPLAYVHMPVPINRVDETFFRPLLGLALAPETELYLGVVARDGVEGTRRRIEAAKHFAPNFGIATECGMARARTPDLVNCLIDIHAEVARTVPRPHNSAITPTKQQKRAPGNDGRERPWQA